MASLNALLAKARGEDGYQEKASNSNLDSKTANAGYNNFTKYSRDVNNAGLAGCQGQPWCGTVQFWLDLMLFGVTIALQLWNMTRSTYCAYSVFGSRTIFQRKGKYVKTPKLGYGVVFKQSHFGRIIGVTATHITVMEGNTSAKYGERNGGCVRIKTYSRKDPLIDGYCVIEYDAAPKAGWVKDSKGWWYRNADGTWPSSRWSKIGGKWYYFNASGYAVTGWHKIDGKWYLLAPLDSCAMLTGWQKVGGYWYYLTPGDDGSMKTGWQQIKGKWYYLRGGDSGRMLTGWQKIDNKWYYMRGGNDGSMVASAWIKDKGKEYYLESNGVMATSKWIGKWYVGADGAWIPNYKG